MENPQLPRWNGRDTVIRRHRRQRLEGHLRVVVVCTRRRPVRRSVRRRRRPRGIRRSRCGRPRNPPITNRDIGVARCRTGAVDNRTSAHQKGIFGHGLPPLTEYRLRGSYLRGSLSANRLLCTRDRHRDGFAPRFGAAGSVHASGPHELVPRRAARRMPRALRSASAYRVRECCATAVLQRLHKDLADTVGVPARQTRSSIACSVAFSSATLTRDRRALLWAHPQGHRAVQGDAYTTGRDASCANSVAARSTRSIRPCAGCSPSSNTTTRGNSHDGHQSVRRHLLARSTA